MPYLLSVWPLLLCPVAMGVMMWVMMRGMSGQQNQSRVRQPLQPLQPLQPYISGDERLRPVEDVVESLPTDGADSSRSMMVMPTGAPAQDQYASLTARLAEVEQQQRRLARELATLDEVEGEASTTAASAYAPARGSDA